MSSSARADISLGEARALAVAAQCLAAVPVAPVDSMAVLRTIDRLGVLQVDTISVVERSQYLVLWSRLGSYDPGLLDSLLFPRRLVFECMAPVALIAPMANYRFYQPGMLAAAEEGRRRSREWLAEHPDALLATLEAVRSRGPMASADFERPDGATRSAPWDWHGSKPSRRALEMLYGSGELMVHSRCGGQKLYDLRERVLAEAFGDEAPRDDDLPGAAERVAFFAAHAAEALGIVIPAWLWEYHALRPARGSGKNHRDSALAALEDLVDAGRMIRVSVDGLEGPAYMASSLRDSLSRRHRKRAPARTTLLSPFDSLIWDRARTRALFGFDVCFEAYVPPARRRFGYYCLPILHGNRLVGRLDPKMDRASRRLLVRAAYLEPDARIDEALLDGVAAALLDLARFLGGSGVHLGDRGSAELIEGLATRLRD